MKEARGTNLNIDATVQEIARSARIPHTASGFSSDLAADFMPTMGG
ncbi:hypothetical protein K2D_31710 [Planctomycetes bacterium K2D]|nr:hypothetical protein K2D_31710 [Planctomycetes bacterium K2D]